MEFEELEGLVSHSWFKKSFKTFSCGNWNSGSSIICFTLLDKNSSFKGVNSFKDLYVGNQYFFLSRFAVNRNCMTSDFI